MFFKKKSLLEVFGNAKAIGLERNYYSNSQMYLETLIKARNKDSSIIFLRTLDPYDIIRKDSKPILRTLGSLWNIDYPPCEWIVLNTLI